MAKTNSGSAVSIIQSPPSENRYAAGDGAATDLSVEKSDIHAPDFAVRRPLTPRIIVVVMSAALGLLAVWFILFAFVLTALQEHSAQTRLYEKFRLQLAQETAALAEPIKVGTPVAMITAEPAGIHNVVIIEGTTSRVLEAGPGHLSDTPLPGQIGDSVLLGRSVTYGAPFGAISSMKRGQLLTVTTGQGAFLYKIEDVRYPGDPLPQALTTGQSRLTLVTSGDTGWRNGWAPTNAVYVDALLAHGRAQPVPTGVPFSVPKSSEPMQTDASGVVAFIFWMEGFVFAGFAMIRSWGRWGRYRSWLVGTPVLLVALWEASNAVMRFLPNLL